MSDRFDLRRILMSLAAPALAIVVAVIVTSAHPRSWPATRSVQVWSTILSAPRPRVSRGDHQRLDRLLHLGDRRGDRLPDEPVQHRGRRPVPRRRIRRRGRRRPGLAARAAQHPARPHRGHAGGRDLGGDRGPAQGLPRRLRGHLDDHAQRDRDDPRRVPAAQGRLAGPRACNVIEHQATCRGLSGSRHPARSRVCHARSTACSSSPSSSASSTGSSSTRPDSASTCGRPAGPSRRPWPAASRSSAWS